MLWNRWLEEEHIRPKATDWYLLMIVRELLYLPARVWGKNPPAISLEELLPKFERKKVSSLSSSSQGKDKPMTEEEEKEYRAEATRMSKALWAARKASTSPKQQS
jgi:hypothetical protein